MSKIVNSRRDFIKKTCMAGIAATGLSNMKLMAELNHRPLVKDSRLAILFQGDSITDGNRGRTADPNHILGHGYAFNIASRVGATYPEKNLAFFNRGISGNKVTDLAARWQKDTLDIKPDVLSILVGVNDTGSIVNQKDNPTADIYEETYRSILDKTRSQLPDCVFVMCEPFILPVGKVKENWEIWNTEIRKKQAVVNKMAKEYKAIYVPLQAMFNEACNRTAADYWIWDGIHPTYSGHGLFSHQWLKEVGKQIHFFDKLKF